MVRESQGGARVHEGVVWEALSAEKVAGEQRA
jgi:hypothetical protein